MKEQRGHHPRRSWAPRVGVLPAQGRVKGRAEAGLSTWPLLGSERDWGWACQGGAPSLLVPIALHCTKLTAFHPALGVLRGDPPVERGLPAGRGSLSTPTAGPSIAGSSASPSARRRVRLNKWVLKGTFVSPAEQLNGN